MEARVKLKKKEFTRVGVEKVLDRAGSDVADRLGEALGGTLRRA